MRPWPLEACPPPRRPGSPTSSPLRSYPREPHASVPDARRILRGPRPSPRPAQRRVAEGARYAWAMADDVKIRLGGRALANGVLVHGPTSWACSIRLPDGTLQTAAGEKPLQSRRVRNRLLRGPARLAEVFAVLPRIRHDLPGARLPFERASVAASMALGAVLIQAVRRSRLHPF